MASKRVKLNKNSIKIFRRLFGYIQPYMWIALVGLITNAFYAGSNAYFVYLIKPITDEGFIAKDADFLHWLPFIIVGLFLFRGAMNLVGSYTMSWVSNTLVLDLRRLMFQHLLSLPSRFYDKSSSGELLAKITYNASQVTSAGTDAIVTVVQSVFQVLGFLIVMFTVNWRLTLMYMLIAPFIAYIISITNRRARRLSLRVQEAIGQINHVAEESIEGYKVVRTFGGEAYETEKFNVVTEANRRHNMRLVVTKALTVTSVQLCLVVVLAITIFLATNVVDGSGAATITAGGFVAMITAMMAIMKPMKNLTRVTANIQKGLAGAQSIFALLDLELEEDKGSHEVERVQGHVEYRNVSFAYELSAQNVIENVSFSAETGKTVALVGRSGSGKSTLVNLLPRFYESLSGEIFVDGIAAKDYCLTNLRKHISVVSQHVILFNDTIAHNIAYGRLGDVTDEDIIKACEAAHAMEFIATLPNGIHTQVGENGVLLSGGQRQRLAIARAILKDAPILILDEATSALDTEAERYIQSALEELMMGRTTLVIAHRLSTVEKADLILVIDEGRVVESGNHDELITQSGHYAKLHKMQFRDPKPNIIGSRDQRSEVT